MDILQELELLSDEQSESQNAQRDRDYLAPAPDATQYYRLGVLYRATGNTLGARQKLRRAAELNEPAIRELAERELRQLDGR